MTHVCGPRGFVGGRHGRVGRLLVDGSSWGGGIKPTFSTGIVLAGLRVVVLRLWGAQFSFSVGAKSWRGVGRTRAVLGACLGPNPGDL